MRGAKFVKNAQGGKVDILQGHGHEVLVEEVLPLVDEGVAVHVITGGQEEMITIDQIVGDAWIDGFDSDEKRPTKIEEFTRGTIGSFAFS